MSWDRKFSITCLIMAAIAGGYGLHQQRRAEAFADVTRQVLEKTTAALEVGIRNRDAYCASLRGAAE